MIGEYEEKGSSFGTVTVYNYPSGVRRISLEDLKNMLDKADELLEEGDYIQACEKYYKVTEEIIKILAEIFAPNTLKEVSMRMASGTNPWDTRLLYSASAEISKQLGDELGTIIREGWRSGLNLHRDCFHEFFMTSEDISDAIGKVKRLFNLSIDIIQEWETNSRMFATINVIQKPIVLFTINKK